jgi:hypothetical protein
MLDAGDLGSDRGVAGRPRRAKTSPLALPVQLMALLSYCHMSRSGVSLTQFLCYTVRC